VRKVYSQPMGGDFCGSMRGEEELEANMMGREDRRRRLREKPGKAEIPAGRRSRGFFV
jgi:hypothetical protein